jgi:cobalamin synthase
MGNMNVGIYACLVLAIIFGIMALVFTVFGKKATVLISGFNSLPKTERELYDTERMSKDQKNTMLLWSIIMAAGAIFSYLVSPYISVAAFVVWLIVFFKDVHMDTDKAFGKYKIK